MTRANGQVFPEQPDILKSLEKFYMVTRTDGEGLITYTNSNFLETSKWTPKRVLGKSFWQMFPETEVAQETAHNIWNELLDGKTWFGTAEKATRHHQSYFVNMLAIPFLDAKNELMSVTFFELDITKDVQTRKQLQEIAFIDFETGLMSRHKLEATVNDYIEEDQHFSLVYLTIDHFYTLKDLQSSEAEKELIKAFTNRLKRYFQDNPLARIGPNEFVVLTPFGNWYIQGFLHFLEQQPIYVGNSAMPLSVSGGIVRYPEDQRSYSHLMKAAMAAAKEVVQSGGNKITALSTEAHKEINRRAVIDQKLLSAIRNRKLQVVYQAQKDLKTEQINVYEALVRWEDPELGTVTPDEIIPIAEENGLIHEVGAYVIEEAAKTAALWYHKGHPFSFSINTSVREFSDSRMKEKITEILRTTNCPAHLLQLEITETFAFQAEEERSIVKQMQMLHDAGIEFTLDDFGTGYASFRFMQSLPISKVKIDKVFVHSITTLPRTQKLVEGMIQFCHSMGLYVIAEGVETEEQLSLLKTMGVDAVQGYYISEPIIADKIAFP